MQQRVLWESLHEAGNGLWSAKVPEANTANVSTITDTQMYFGRYAPASGYDALLASYDPATDAGKQKLARLCSCTCQASAA
jgi:hypothetical protein